MLVLIECENYVYISAITGIYSSQVLSLVFFSVLFCELDIKLAGHSARPGKVIPGNLGVVYINHG
jgi:hypothetical protein